MKQKFTVGWWLLLVSEPAVLAGIARWEADTCITFTRQYNRPSGNGLEFFLGSGFAFTVLYFFWASNAM